MRLPPAPPCPRGSIPSALSQSLGCARRGHSPGLRHGCFFFCSPSRLTATPPLWRGPRLPSPPSTLCVTSIARTPFCFLHKTRHGGLHRSLARLPAGLRPLEPGPPQLLGDPTSSTQNSDSPWPPMNKYPMKERCSPEGKYGIGNCPGPSETALCRAHQSCALSLGGGGGGGGCDLPLSRGLPT